ncbi:MAG: HemK2/MTQ2 family protein methyltransferase [Candidatus Micrarchaeota archaeon]
MTFREKKEKEIAGTNSRRPTKGNNSGFAFGDLTLKTYLDVYYPHEDSFLLSKAASEHAFGKVLDLGCGSGIAGISAMRKKGVKSVTFADISNSAVVNAKANVERNKAQLFSGGCRAHFIRTDLFSNLEGKKFDTMLFNPPYLPTSKGEKLKGEINRAFDGGNDGRKIIDRFFSQFTTHLESGGILLYLDSSLTDSGKTEVLLGEKGLSFDELSNQRFFFEELRVLKIRKI